MANYWANTNPAGFRSNVNKNRFRRTGDIGDDYCTVHAQIVVSFGLVGRALESELGLPRWCPKEKGRFNLCCNHEPSTHGSVDFMLLPTSLAADSASRVAGSVRAI